MSRFPARIHVLLARDAPIGLVIRRGPAKSVATLLWNRRKDTFELGQWLRGRIYERRCDLSPDGRYFIYFAMNGRWNSESRGAWTAISRAPYLKALAMFPKGDCWNGGGLWTGTRSYWLNEGCGHSVLRNTTLVNRDTKWRPSRMFGGECTGVYYPRLLRDGWTLNEQNSSDSNHRLTFFERACPHGWALRKIAHEQVDSPPGKGCYWDEHALIHESTGTSIAQPDWEWADLDGKRLVWAIHGTLQTARLSAKGLEKPKLLHDFNEMTFTPIQAPD